MRWRSFRRYELLPGSLARRECPLRCLALRPLSVANRRSIMSRIVLILAWAVCVLSLLATGGIWIRSYFARDELSCWSAAVGIARSEWTERCVTFGRGQLRLDYRSRLDTGRWALPTGVTPGFKHESTEPFPAYMHIDGRPVDFARWGFIVDYDRSVRRAGFGGGESRWLGILVVVPIWAVMSACAAAVFLPVVIAAKRARCLREAHCVSCGYDLRASPGRCPECGTVSGQRATG